MSEIKDRALDIELRVKRGIKGIREAKLRCQFEAQLPELGRAADAINWDFLSCLGVGNKGLLVINQLSPTRQKRREFEQILRNFREDGLGSVEHGVTKGWAGRPILISSYTRPYFVMRELKLPIKDLHLGSNMRIEDKKPLRILLYGIGEFVFVGRDIISKTISQLEDCFDLTQIHADRKGRFFYYGDQELGLKFRRISKVRFPWQDRDFIMYALPESSSFKTRARQRRRISRFVPAAVPIEA